MRCHYHRLFILAILLISPLYVSAKINYIDYHKKIIIAERHFLNGELKTSLQKYKEVFKEYDEKPMVKDAFIAAQIACLVPDTNNASYFLTLSFRHGINWKLLNDSKSISQLFINDAGFKKRMQNVYSVMRTEYVRSIDTALRYKIQEMIRIDGYYKISVSGKYRRESKDTAQWKTGDSLYASVLDSNILEIENIISKYGYPGEHMIGISDNDIARPKRENSNSLPDGSYRFIASIPALMFYHHEYGFQRMHSSLLQAVMDGELDPREYALIYEWSYNQIKKEELYTKKFNGAPQYKTSYNFLPLKVKGDAGVRDQWYNIYLDPKYYSKDTVLVNECRERIGLCNLLHDKRKREFEQKNGIKLYLEVFRNI